MIFLIVMATIVAAIIYVVNIEISTKEFLLMAAAMVVACLAIYGIASIPFPNDDYFESGKLIATAYHPYFVERYQMPHTVCHPCGKSTCCHTYYTTEYAKHQPYWSVLDSLEREWEVPHPFHNEVKTEFGNRKITTRPNKCTHGGVFHSGDPYLYVYKNETNSYKYPTNQISRWYNPIKRGKSTIFKAKTEYKRDYPQHIDNYSTTRVEVADGINRHDWDVLNTKVFEKKGVSLSLIKVGTTEEAKKVEDVWIKGKKNDLVICVKGSYKKPEFVKVFGWSKSSFVRYMLEQDILQEGVNLEEIERIVVKYYEPYDWNRFGYLTIKPPFWVFIIALIFVCVIGRIMYVDFSNNWEDKTNSI